MNNTLLYCHTERSRSVTQLKFIFNFLLLGIILCLSGCNNDKEFKYPMRLNSPEYYTTEYCYLYAKPDIKSKKIGAFIPGATISLVKKENEFWDIKVNLVTEGYILEKNIAEEEKEIDYESDILPEFDELDKDENGTPLLYVNAASLRGRKEPNTNSWIVTVLKTNDLFYIDFLPFGDGKWISYGTLGYYVKKDFLGNKIDLQEIINEYRSLDSKNKNERKKIAERIFETSFEEEEEELKYKSVKLFLDFLKEDSVTNKELIRKLKGENFVLLNSYPQLSCEEKNIISESPQTFINIGGNLIFNHQDIKYFITNNSPQKTSLSEESIYNDSIYMYEWGRIVYDYESEFCSLLELNISDVSFCQIDGVVLNKNSYEEYIIRKLGQLITIADIDIENNEKTYNVDFCSEKLENLVFHNSKLIQYYFYYEKRPLLK